jgi:DNA-binding XRE family transcriptional regulator
MKARLMGLLNVLAEKGNELREPYSKPLGDGIFELRGQIGNNISRVLYFFTMEGKLYRKDGIWMERLEDFMQEQLKNPEFRKEYEAIQAEMAVIKAMVDARISQNLTQKELAKRTGIHQSDISKLENGTRNPSINLLKRLADGMDMVLKIEFVPKQKA